MTSQIFKQSVPSEHLVEFIKSNCDKEGNFHVFSKVHFRRALYHDRVKPFCERLTDYYHTSKQYYVKRSMDYSKFTTVLRQLCKLHNLPYTSRIVYNKSTYDILYYISMSD